MENKVQVFNNKELELQVRTLPNPDGSISISAEDAAIGFGWYQKKEWKSVPKMGNFKRLLQRHWIFPTCWER